MQQSLKVQEIEYRFEESHKMHGVKRVLVFCLMIVILPATLIIVPLYLKKTVFADVTYQVTESDIIEIREGISSIFCEKHSLRMSSNFNAFQLRSKPEVSTNHKHIRLKKSMTLPDDTLEYWGFYLLKGAKVHLKFCSRYDGSRILVVKGERNLNTCGLLDHNKNKLETNLAQGHETVKVFFEEITEIHEKLPIDEELERKSNNDDNFMLQENHAGEDSNEDSEEDRLYSSTTTTTKNPIKKLKKGSFATRQRKTNNASKAINKDEINSLPLRTEIVGRPRRQVFSPTTQQVQQVYDQLYKKRAKRQNVLDRKYSHGGNAVNYTETDESNSISSFENGLFECFNGAILLAEGFPPSSECLNAHFLENGTHRMLSKHDISADGYYYYIFYSDNDLVRNDIHAIFDIYKPTFQYSNLSESQNCVNSTNCSFPISFLSDEIVVVEIPTRDGIEHEEDDITYLISTCHPRTGVYIIFPITVLLLILCCSFL